MYTLRGRNAQRLNSSVYGLPVNVAKNWTPGLMGQQFFYNSGSAGSMKNKIGNHFVLSFI